MAEQPEGRAFTLWQAVAEGQRRHAEAEARRPRKHLVEGERPRETDPASGWLEADDFETPLAEGELDEGRDRRRRTYTRQIGIRLSPAQHAELSGAADLYGVAPGTMARMLVRRGARAVLDARRRYDLELGG